MSTGALDARPSEPAAEALLELACRLAEGRASCRDALAATPSAGWGEPSRPIAAALFRLRNTPSWAALSSDHLAAAMAARDGRDWGAFAFLVAEETRALGLASAADLAEAMDELLRLIDRLAQRHPGEPRLWALCSKVCAALVAVYCAHGDKPAASQALHQAVVHGRRCWAEPDVRLHLHEAAAVLARHRRDHHRAWRHFFKALVLTGPDRQLRSLELKVELAVLLSHYGASPSVIEHLVLTGLTALEPLAAVGEPILRAHLIYRKAWLVVEASHELCYLRPPLELPLGRIAEELEGAAELFAGCTDPATQGIRLLLLGELWGLGRHASGETGSRRALDTGGRAQTMSGEEIRAALGALIHELAEGRTH